MPYRVQERACRQADGTHGSYVVDVLRPGGLWRQASCHLTAGAARGAMRARYRGESLGANTALRRDPTRTVTLRARFVREVNRRFRDLKRDIRISIVDRDCFGIIGTPYRILAHALLWANAPAGHKAFDFPTTQAKVMGFVAWLEEQDEIGILQSAGGPAPWEGTYYADLSGQAMERGRAQARYHFQAAGIDLTIPGRALRFMPDPIIADRLVAIHGRIYEDLKTVLSQQNAQVRRLISDGLTTGLSRGLAEGKNPITIARALVKDVNNQVDKIGVYRARMIARTEILRAHHIGNIAEFHRAEALLGRALEYDWVLGAAPCPICTDWWAGNPYPLREVEGEQPAHPHCVCTLVPRVTGKEKPPPGPPPQR